MLSTIEKQLNESQRDALITGYLTFVAPNLKDANGQILDGQQVTVEDLYEYLLIDPKVGDEVQTSRVAQAIASVQEYMTRIINGVEPGFQAVKSSVVNVWRETDNQYAIWAASVDVQNYPENYISPTTRLEKSHYFKELETTLNQNQLDPDRVQNAALAYLNEFEAVSNLTVLSGYINQDDLSQAIYYFIGRTTTKPYRYYWRQMDLSKNRKDCQAKPVTPNCWSDWQPINLPLSGDNVLEHTVRPVFYNNRLFVAWVERDPTPQKGKDNENTKKHAYRVVFGYKRYDGSWTAPNSTTLATHQDGDKVNGNDKHESERIALVVDEAVDENGESVQLRDINLLATTDHSIDPGGATESNPYGRLMLGVFVRNFIIENDTEKNVPDVYGYLYCDSAFNRRELMPLLKSQLFASFKDKTDTKTLQYGIYQEKYVIEKVEPYGEEEEAPDGNNIHCSSPDDLGDWWKKISDLVATETGPTSRVYMKDSQTMCIEMALEGDFLNDFEFNGQETTSGSSTGYGFCRPNGKAGVTIRYNDNDLYTFENTAFRYDVNLFGLGGLSDGSNAIVFPIDWSGTSYDIINIDIQSNKIRFSGSGAYSENLDLSGRRLSNKAMNFAIENKLFEPYFRDGDTNSVPAQIENFDKTAKIRKFFELIQIWTPKGDNHWWAGPDSTPELKANSTAAHFAHEYTLSESDFTASEHYLSVNLIVKWDHFDHISGARGAQHGVWRWFKVYVEKRDLDAPANLPQLKSRYDSKRGLVQYLDFCDDSLPAKTRLNTTFVRTLIKKANLGLDSLLDYTLQADASLEADLVTDGKSEAMDFNGANGLYFWELFFHMPFLVATRFASEQQFDLAQKWLHYIFDPSARNKGRDPESGVTPPDYWNVRPLMEHHGDLSKLLADSLDPDTQAYANPEVYQKAVFIAYVRNLVAQGDVWYRQLTRDGLTQARVYYNFVAELLGSRPDASISSNWQARSLGTLAEKETIENSAIRQFEHTLDPTVLPALPGRYTSYLSSADHPYFTDPLNTLMLSHWDTLEARLYNLRHNLTVDGKPLSLPLYAAPADPVALLSQRAQAGTLSAGVSGAMQIVPPYRFSAMLPRAYNAVATLSRFGETLLSLLERSERAGQEELAQQQLLDMSSYAITLQQQAIDGLVADRAALQASQATAQLRHDRYYALYQENISDAERTVMDTHTLAQGFFAGAQGLQIASGALKEVPNIYGFADGGSRYEGATEAVGGVMQLQGQVATLIADRLATAEGYRRRRQEWQIQYEQAQAEVDALTKQLDALVIREKAARTALQQTQAQQAQVKAMLTYLKSRFTQATLYQWLSGQLAAQYYQAYDAVVSLCLSTQACWQYEMGDFATTFIQPGIWNDHYRGLQVGETLQLNLHQMEAAYLARHERRLEVTRTVSLKDLLGDDFKIQRGKGCFGFDLKEKLFDGDYPGHYLRQIKSVSITLPTSLGPYQDVKATLTQTKSSTLLQADLNGVKYLIKGQGGTTDAIITNLRASQQIALSSGLNDAGQFELNFSDERYLPFEGTGAVSTWELKFPRHDRSPQSDLLAHLDDVIVHVRYTALDGGESFAHAVEKLLS
ncbi:insecticidal toxin complex protein TccB [Mycetohabitans sp. B8]|uniref:Tc toxin subunit A-related protein n=1 Tax=Mycetohabitans sp. B8 TaxID=2841845 RepID=UPI001F4818FE|nr:neuraminidase-like domain-containing protein [Mycetohabitans sp. B8]MCG1041750.1 insecticidal toxin complex protein TccB [Mycetohabitans sp. B8]